MNVLALRPIEEAKARRHAVDYDSFVAGGDDIALRLLKRCVGAPVSQEKKP